MDLARANAPLLARARVVNLPIPREELRRDLHAFAPQHPRYIQALARLAGVKVRKARIFLGLDQGRITLLAEQMLVAARSPLGLAEAGAP